MSNDRIYSVNELVDALATLSGQVVSVHGVLTIKREHHTISQLSASERRANLRSNLWVYFHHATLGTREGSLAEFDGQTVIATGVLDVSRKGHFGIFPGSLTIRKLVNYRPSKPE